MQRKELPVIQKLYDFILWFTNHIDNYPKARRFTLGRRIEDNLYDLLQLCIEARYSGSQSEKLTYLKKANTRLETLRYFIRLCHAQRLMSNSQLKFTGEQLNGIGQALGGWIKEVRERKAPYEKT